jgi:hypothetical protein
MMILLVGLRVQEFYSKMSRIGPAGQMCNYKYKVRLGDVAEVDAELLGWISAAYQAAGFDCALDQVIESSSTVRIISPYTVRSAAN